MIRLRDVTLSRGGENLLRGANADIRDGECVALIGRNGSGKTTLLAALMGLVSFDNGQMMLPPGKIHALAQSIPRGQVTCSRYVLLGHPELAKLDDDVREAASASTSTGEHHHDDNDATPPDTDRWLSLGGDRAASRIAELLDGLGFSAEQMAQPVDELSGGWRMRLNLARAMFVPSQLLLLDEPTNHLDLDAILWLERWLKRYPGTCIVVSHDRDFLDRVAHASLAIEGQKLIRYKGGYSDAENARIERERQQNLQAVQQVRRVEHLNRFITRFRAQATKASQVQSRIKAIEKMAVIAQYAPPRDIDFSLADVADAPDPLLVAESIDVGYPNLTLLRRVNLVLNKGARLGILGRNGAGKSTLVRSLIGELPIKAGELRSAGSLRVGYFAQTAVESLSLDDTPLQVIRRLWPDDSEAKLRGRLGNFGFTGEQALRNIGTMSGGEKARLVLATIVTQQPHLLVLDEPTNHLDGATRDSLAEALIEFDGALLLVSHDRYLMRASVDRFILVDADSVRPFDGDLDDYVAWLMERGDARTGIARNRGALSAEEGTTTPLSQKEERRLQAERRQRLAQLLRPIERELEATEQSLHKIEGQLASVDQELNNPLLYQGGQGERIGQLGKEQSTLREQRDHLEARWLELAEQRDAAQTEP